MEKMVMSPDQKTILIVDDEETLTWSMSKNLSLNNRYKVICANSGEEALTVLQKTGYVDLVVSDIKMQGKNGLQLLSDVKAKYPRTSFILMTAFGTDEKRQEAIEKGAIRYIEKPFMMDKVKTVIQEVFEEMDKTKVKAIVPVTETVTLKTDSDPNRQIREFFQIKSRQIPELISIKLTSRQGEVIWETKAEDKVFHASKAFRTIDSLSEKITGNALKEVIMSTENQIITLQSVNDSPFMLYAVFDANTNLGRALHITGRLQAQLKTLID